MKRACQIIAFPALIHRCWLVERCEGAWRGRTVGIPAPDDAITGIGELHLVMDALSGRGIGRRGLPIVVAGDAFAEQVAA